MNNTNTMNLTNEEHVACHGPHPVKMKSHEEACKAIVYETRIDETGKAPFCNIYTDPESVKGFCKGIRIVLGIPALITILVGYVDANAAGNITPIKPGMAEFLGKKLWGSFIKDPDTEMMRFIDTADSVNNDMVLSQLKPIGVLMGRDPQVNIPLERPIDNLVDLKVLPPIEVCTSQYLGSDYRDNFQNRVFKLANDKNIRVVYDPGTDDAIDCMIEPIAECAYKDPQKVVAGTEVSWLGIPAGIFIKDPDDDNMLRLIIYNSKVSKKDLRRQLYRLEKLVKCEENADL